MSKRLAAQASNLAVKRDWLKACFARFQPAPYLTRYVSESTGGA